MQTLKKRADFLTLSNSGKKVFTKTFTMLYSANSLTEIRVGYTVSKKISKLAVERNKIKRRLRAAVREVFPKHAKEQHDYVIIGKRTILERDFLDLKGDIEYALKKI